MAERKAALRRHAGEKRWRRLGRRRIVSDTGRFHEDAPANGVYNIDAPEGDAARARELAGLQVQRNLMWEHRRFTAFHHLDSLVSMITLGQQGLADEELRQRVQPATVACVYMLIPRRMGEAATAAVRDTLDAAVEAGCRGEDAAGERADAGHCATSTGEEPEGELSFRRCGSF